MGDIVKSASCSQMSSFSLGVPKHSGKNGAAVMLSDLKCLLPKDVQQKVSSSKLPKTVALLKKNCLKSGISISRSTALYLKIKAFVFRYIFRRNDFAKLLDKQVGIEEMSAIHRKFFSIKTEFANNTHRLYGVSIDFSEDVIEQVHQKILITHEYEDKLPTLSDLKTNMKKEGLIKVLQILNNKMSKIEQKEYAKFNSILKHHHFKFELKPKQTLQMKGFKKNVLKPLGYTKKGNYRNFSEVKMMLNNCGVIGLLTALTQQIEAQHLQAKAIKHVFHNLEEKDCLKLVCKQEKLRSDLVDNEKNTPEYIVDSSSNSIYSYKLKVLNPKRNEVLKHHVTHKELKKHLKEVKNLEASIEEDPTKLFETLRTELNLSNKHTKKLLSHLESLSVSKVDDVLTYKNGLFEINMKKSDSGIQINKRILKPDATQELIIQEDLEADSSTSQISGGFKIYSPSMTVNDGMKKAHLVLRPDKCQKEHDAKTFDKDTKILQAFIDRGIKQVPNLTYSNSGSEENYGKQFTVLENFDLDGKDYYRKKCKNLDREIRIQNFHKIALELTEGLVDIHTAGYILVDIKPRNFMINLNDDDKIERVVFIDFGLVKEISRYQQDSDGNIKVQSGTEGYQAPEVANESIGKGEKPLDIFSLGLTLAEIRYRGKLLTGDYVKKITEGKLTEEDVIAAFSESCGKDKKYFNALDKFLLKMLKINPAERPTAEEVYKYFLKANPM